MNNNEIRALKSTVYYAGAKFSNFPDFFNILQTGKKLDSVTEELILEEFNKLLEQKEKFPFVSEIYGNPNYFHVSYGNICSVVNKYFSNEIVFPELYIIDELPNEYKNKPWVAMFIDEEDAKRVGIKAGIYYKQSSLSHPFFDFIITHELIHWVISHFSKTNFPHSNLLEEGICDFLCYYILIDSEWVSGQVLSNFLIYNRSLSSADSLAGMYYRFSKLILNNVYSLGIDSLFQTIRQGRGEVNKTRLLFTGLVENSKTINSIIKAFNNAENIVTLSSYAYMIFKEIIERNLTFFTKDDIKKVPTSTNAFNNAFDKLLELNLITNHEDHYYQGMIFFPDNIKFQINNEMAT